ncbi:bifunctional UDP-N-acetylglucosamine diphosphorylase/glucosamine-1-phosphate N-acetyltransferase GlmU [Denitrobaculum tricleocarpae]|uniref:Bifunctional protein GlmU n=1 Tax=Denitrobaculum tricleocarpae TaxID=2591009 RepID=A0A545TUC2_9PROT|nr:bifunctional UDP-N-acetylglucosamine diphosphorylase/glucosamine-1-phosphate N-acetyltransferase GlmU [Denitrobaculum tricleocarpae]TQV80761.1 bifunctional UDP-N-acetylglucosamine diphosphorylase/glucosamine-1-phosphate N-acetyltransferase GlmU [Denitrobaculum tricleocarpae]
MTSNKLAVVVLAAGQGTRMKSELPKVLHPVAGRAMLRHVLDAAESLEPERIIVVVGPGSQEVQKAAVSHHIVVQEERLGTGHAVMCAADALSDYANDDSSDVLVIYGDTPLLTGETLKQMLDLRRETPSTKLVGLAFRPADPAQYGRFLLDASGVVEGIVEFADADEEIRKIDLCNAGPLIGEGRTFLELVKGLQNDNAQGEYYLTDLFAAARKDSLEARIVEAPVDDVHGVNSRAELAVAESVMQDRLRAKAMAGGATLIAPETVWFSCDTVVGRDVVIEPNVIFGPSVVISDNVQIRAFSHVEGAKIENGAIIGPYARLRPGTEIGVGVKIGNFVECKNAIFGTGSKANHLSYVGDSTVGPKANIGAGTITCNYDGFNKSRTVIGAGAFIGSNSALVAPVTIGEGALVGAGSTIVEEVPKDSMALGRGRQVVFPERAAFFRELKKKD